MFADVVLAKRVELLRRVFVVDVPAEVRAVKLSAPFSTPHSTPCASNAKPTSLRKPSAKSSPSF